MEQVALNISVKLLVNARYGSFSTLFQCGLLKEIPEGLSEIMQDWFGKLLQESPCIQQLLVRVLHHELEVARIKDSAALRKGIQKLIVAKALCTCLMRRASAIKDCPRN